MVDCGEDRNWTFFSAATCRASDARRDEIAALKEMLFEPLSFQIELMLPTIESQRPFVPAG